MDKGCTGFYVKNFKKATIINGPSKFEMMASLLGGKEIPIIFKKFPEKYPHNILKGQFYAVEVEDDTAHSLLHQENSSDNSDGLLCQGDGPWKVKIIIKMSWTARDGVEVVYYEGTYDPMTRKGKLKLDLEKTLKFQK